jgi:hypothetical protein
MSKNFERFKNKDTRPNYDKPKKNRRPQRQDEAEVDAYTLLKAGYSIEDLSSLDCDN